MADTKLTALSEVSVPALTDIAYWVADPAGTPVSDKISGTRLGGLLIAQQCEGRLTTESGVPVSMSDRTSQGTLYWCPSTPIGSATATGLVGFYDGTRYVVKSLSQLSLSLTVTSGKNYDVFLDWNSGTPALALSAAWTNDTTRADALATQGPFVVKSGSATLRWLGTIRASGSNVTEDSQSKRFVCNTYNQVGRLGARSDVTGHTYNSGTVRYWNNDAANKIEAVFCQAVDALVTLVPDVTLASPNAGLPVVRVQQDWTTSGGTFPGESLIGFGGGASTLRFLVGQTSWYAVTPGYHYWAITEEEASGTSAVCSFGLVGVCAQWSI